MKKKDKDIIPLYRLINKLYSINYSSIRVSEQSTATYNDESSTFSQNWTSSKLQDIADTRINFLNAFFESAQKSKENLDLIAEQIANSKQSLNDVFNIFYDKTANFEEIFDGFICKDPEFSEMINNFETQCFYAENQDIFNIINLYAYYTNTLFSSMISDTTMEIVSQLRNEINENGVPSFYRGARFSENLIQLSYDDIRQLMNKTIEYSKVLKSIKQPKNTDKTEFFVTYNKTAQKYYDLEFFVNQLIARFQSANTDSNASTINKLVEGAIDFISGTAKKDPAVEKIYASKLEMNYIEYLTNLLDFAIEKFKQTASNTAEKSQ